MLPYVEFAYNTAPQESTGKTPFSIVHGREANIPADLMFSDVLPTADQFVAEFHETIDTVHDHILEAQMKQMKQIKYREHGFKAGDKVLLSTENLELMLPSRKLGQIWVGPLMILRMKGPNTVELQIPPRLGKIETTQNVQYLKPYRKRPVSDGPTLIPPAPQVVDGQPEFIVEDILAAKKVGRTIHYLIRWEGYGVEEDSWVPKTELHRNCQSILDTFNQSQLLQPRRRRRILYVRID